MAPGPFACQDRPRERTRFMRPRTVFGLDFSGASQAGRFAWLAELEVTSERPKLLRLASLGTRAGTDDRDVVLSWLVGAIRSSEDALWGIDAPFGLPVELFDAHASWRDQLAWVGAWTGDAKSLGRALMQRSLELFGTRHVRRRTDREEHTPFDCYHYRIIYQTFHAMRDVLGPLSTDAGTVVFPFDPPWPSGAKRAVVEACPSSTLRRLGLPRRGYKQPQGGTLTVERLDVRREILRGLGAHVGFAPSHRRVMLANPGGDAIDAVLAAFGAWSAFQREDLAVMASDARVSREGWVFA